jgi:hypothetical protein
MAEIRPYMHKTILLLVDAHVKTGDTAPAVVSRVLQALVTNVTQVALTLFQQIPKFGTGGMLTVSTIHAGLTVGNAGNRVPAPVRQHVRDHFGQRHPIPDIRHHFPSLQAAGEYRRLSERARRAEKAIERQ